MPQGFFFYVGVAIKKDYNLGLLPVGYLENRLKFTYKTGGYGMGLHKK